MTESRDKVQSAGTTAQILKALGRLAEPSPLSLIAAEADMPPAKAHRYLQALIDTGLAEQDPRTGRYGMGPEIISIGLAALGRVDIMSAAAPEIFDLRDRVAQTCLLSVWGSNGATIVRVVLPPTAVTIVTRLGSVLPMISANGFVFAATLPEDRLVEAADYPAFRVALKTDRKLQAKVQSVHDHGVSSAEGIVVPGINALAAPIFDALGNCEGSLCLLGPEGSLDTSPTGEFAEDLRRTVKAISYRLGKTDGGAA